MSQTAPDTKSVPVVPAINHVRQLAASGMNITEPDAAGTRVLTIDTPMPDSFVIILPESMCDQLKEKLNGGVILARPGDVPAAPPEGKE